MAFSAAERDDGQMTLEQCGALLGIGVERARQIEQAALLKCRVALQLVDLVGWRRAGPILESLRGRRPEFYIDALREVRARKAS